MSRGLSFKFLSCFIREKKKFVTAKLVIIIIVKKNLNLKLIKSYLKFIR